MEKCPNCVNSKLLNLRIENYNDHEYNDTFYNAKSFIINNIDYSIERTLNDSYGYEDESRYNVKIKQIYQDFLCFECGLVLKFVNKDTINKIKFDMKESEDFNKYHNICLTKIDDFIETYINSINDLFKPIDLMLEQALNENLSFVEVTNIRDKLKEYPKEFFNENSEISKLRENLDYLGIRESYFIEEYGEEKGLKELEHKKLFEKKFEIEFKKTLNDSDDIDKYYEKNQNYQNFLFTLTQKSFRSFYDKRTTWASKILKGSLDKFNE